jgi:hypothetical protein
MKVKDLIELLEKEDQNVDVIMASDSEGNGFNPLSCVETSLCEDADGFIELVNEEDVEDRDVKPCVCLWP